MLITMNTVRVGAAIITALFVFALMRFVVYDYVPPEALLRKLGHSVFVTSGMRKPAMAVYGLVALLMMALFFGLVQQRWQGRRGTKGLVFGLSLGVIWSFGFFSGWAFLGTTLRAEFFNSLVDLIPLAFAGWLIGLAVGNNVVRSTHRMWKPWLAVLLVAVGFVSVHALGAWLFAGLFTSTANLFLIPMRLTQIALLTGLGLWAGVMYVMLRTGLPFKQTWARGAFFAFGVFGHSWIWFHVFFVIDLAGVLPAVLFVGLTGAAGVFVGTITYERIAFGKMAKGILS